ncbi:MAG: helix-turn-helix transcriptional regulator [Zetaproteobacteria bacterium]|nr:helix-turn-helix transcriptional regulator [Zetaproteobacteria bacterium]
MSEDNVICDFGCPVEAALAVIGGKWKGIILYHLRSDVRRFNELKRLIPNITQRMLTKQLRELEADQIIHREIFQQIPPKVEYSLTEFGLTLTPILQTIQKWGVEYIEKISKIRSKT